MDITKEGWYKINKLFDGIRECEIYTRDHMANDIIQYYQRLYESNPKRKRMNHNDLKSKIREILHYPMKKQIEYGALDQLPEIISVFHKNILRKL